MPKKIKKHVTLSKKVIQNGTHITLKKRVAIYGDDKASLDFELHRKQKLYEMGLL